MTKVMIVDDDPDIVELIEEILSMAGYETITAYSGEECIERLKENPDLILLDIMMPGMDGWETLERIREIDKNTPVIMVTAKQPTFTIVRSGASKINGYLVKPFTHAALLNIVSDVLEFRENLNSYTQEARAKGVSEELLEEYARLLSEMTSHHELWTLLKQVYPERRVERDASLKNAMLSIQRYIDIQRERIRQLRERIEKEMRGIY